MEPRTNKQTVKVLKQMRITAMELRILKDLMQRDRYTDKKDLRNLLEVSENLRRASDRLGTWRIVKERGIKL